MVYFLYLLEDLFVFAVFANLVDRVEERCLFDSRDLKKDVEFI